MESAATEAAAVNAYAPATCVLAIATCWIAPGDSAELTPNGASVKLRSTVVRCRCTMAAATPAEACADQSPISSLMIAAWASGFTHLGGSPLAGEVTEPKAVVRLQPADLFAGR